MNGLRGIAKQVAFWLATVLLAPLLASFWVRSLIVGRDRALQASTQFLALVPGLSGQYLRRAFLVRSLAFCHPTVTVEFGTIFSQAGARLEENAYVGPHCNLGLVHLGKDVLVGAGVHVPSGPQTHGTADLSKPIREQPGALRMVSIGQGAWIGSTAVVMEDVGAESIIAAGAVVTQPIPERVVAGGVPARVLRARDKQ